MHHQENTSTPVEETPRQWRTQPATGEEVGGAPIDSLGALLLDADRRADRAPSVYFKGVRVDYWREGDEAVFRVVCTYGPPVTELLTDWELRTPLPLAHPGDVLTALEYQVRQRVPEGALLQAEAKTRAKVQAAQERQTQGAEHYRRLTAG